MAFLCQGPVEFHPWAAYLWSLLRFYVFLHYIQLNLNASTYHALAWVRDIVDEIRIVLGKTVENEVVSSD